MSQVLYVVQGLQYPAAQHDKLTQDQRRQYPQQFSRLHAGQLRYHSFNKLRELQNSKNRPSPILTIDPFNSSRFSTQQQPQVRFFWSSLGNSLNNTQSRGMISNPISATLNTLQLKQLERSANEAMNDPEVQYKFLSELAKSYPLEVINRMRHPSFKNAAVNIETALLYIRILQETDKIIYLDIDDLLQRVAKSSSSLNPTILEDWRKQLSRARSDGVERKLSKAEQAQELYRFLASSGGLSQAGLAASAGAYGSLIGAPGYSPRNPLHVEVVSSKRILGAGSSPLVSSISSKFFGLLTSAVGTLIIVSAIGAFLDDRGLGKGITGMGSSKHIQEADLSGGASGNKRKIKFEDVKGVEEAKAELEEIVMYLKDPSKFTRLGGTLPRGLLLTGPPGTGKTLLAKAIAGEADVPFFYSSGSQFEEVYVGLGAKRIRELFEAAKKKAPAIIFIDEIDAVGGTRKLKDQSALKMTLNELLVQLDGFDENNGIIVIGATNFMESLDSALLRPGRFDKHVTVPLPDVGGRKEILEMYAKKTKLAPDADLNVLARGTTGMSGADLYNLINQAALKASIDGLSAIDMKTLEYAKDKILMGAERKTAVITEETAKCTAYHEAGHAIVAVLTDGAIPIHKATIMPRGNALGMVTMLPESDQTSQSYKQMIAYMDIAMGGRVAEELVFGKEQVTSGASSDIQVATRLARNMVTKFGFSDAVGIVYHGGNSGEESASPETRALIDNEVKKLTDTAYQRARELLQKYSKEHKMLAETLLEYETLTGDEVRDVVLRHKKPKRPAINKNNGARGDSSVLKLKPAPNAQEPEKQGSRTSGLLTWKRPSSTPDSK